MPRDALQPHHDKENKVQDDLGLVDVPFLALVILLVGIGLLMMFSASYVRASYTTGKPLYYFVRQGGFALFGLAAMYMASRINVHLWQFLAKAIYAVSVALLLAVLVVGVSSHGARRWISFAGQQFQPSEVAKFGLICMLASQINAYREKMAHPHYGVFRVGITVATVVLLVVAEKHLSALMIIGIVSVVMLYVGGTDKRWLLALIALAAIFIAVYIFFMGYAGDRITAWLDPEADAQDTGYQILQSQYAIGSGGFFGLGFGMGRQKHLYLPEEHNDYIFAIVCEELGFIGALGIIVLFALLIIRGYQISLHAADRFSTLLGVGITTLLAVQVALNMCVVCNLLPSTGIGLPFFSYGGTNLLMNLGEMGIMLSISRWSSSAKS